MASPPQAPIRILVYLLRRDLRLADNPIFHELSRLQKQSHRPFTHLLPLYVFPAEQVEVSGFVKQDEKSPYPEARSQVGGFWRTGRLRSKFLAESVWDLKEDLRKIESDLVVRVGSMGDAVSSVLQGLREQKGTEIHGVWMTKEEGWEEQYQDRGVRAAVKEDQGEEFKMWTDEKYFVDDRDLPFDDPRHLSDVFTNFRKTVEPLRAAPRQELPKPSILPPLPSNVPPPANPFTIPDTLDETIKALQKPINSSMGFQHMPDELPKGVQNAHPFSGGSKSGHQRIQHLIESGAMTSYKDTRNGLLGLDFSTKLSAWLAHGSITARQIHWALMEFEDGKGDLGRNTQGYGGGENKGTAGVRFELLWRDYMRLCTRKFGTRLFFLDGYKSDSEAGNKFISSPFSASTAKRNQNGANNGDTRAAVERFLQGRTGIGLIDASQRELFLTGWTSNRARQNVASFLAKHLGIDWRLGAEWYETNLIDYDLSSNWGNWQYVAGVGNDPRGDARVFNPVKQAVDYDTNGEYVRSWVPELRDVGRRGQGEQNGGVPLPGEKQQGQGSSMEDLMGVFQAWRMPDEEKKRLGLQDVEWVQKPLIRINFSVNRRGGGDQKRGGGGGGGGGPGGSGGGGFRGKGRGRGSGKPKTEGGRNARSGTMEKAGWQ